MRRSVLSGLVVVALAVGSSVAWGDDKDKAGSKDKTVTGVLIDQACAGKMMSKDDPEKAAMGHPKSCAMKESCAKSGYAVISGKDEFKLDKDAGDKVKDYFADEKAGTHVTVTGTTNDDGTLTVTSIKAAPDKDDKKDDAK